MSYAAARSLGFFPLDQIEAALTMAAGNIASSACPSGWTCSGPAMTVGAGGVAPFFEYGRFNPTNERWGVWNRFAPYHPELLRTLGLSLQTARVGHDPGPVLVQALAKIKPYVMRAMQDAVIAGLPKPYKDEVGFDHPSEEVLIDEMYQVAQGLAYAAVAGVAPEKGLYNRLLKERDANNKKTGHNDPPPDTAWRTGPGPERGGYGKRTPGAEEIDKGRWALNVYSQLVPYKPYPAGTDVTKSPPPPEQGLLTWLHEAMRAPKLIDPEAGRPPPPPPPPPKKTTTTKSAPTTVLFYTDEPAPTSPMKAILIGGIVAAAGAGAIYYWRRSRAK